MFSSSSTTITRRMVWGLGYARTLYPNGTSPMRTGLDRLATHPHLGATLRSARVGLLAHPASVDRRLIHAKGILDALGVRIALALGPEHGYGGEAQDLIGVPDSS